MLIACLSPSSELPDAPAIPGLDKIIHIGLFAIWSGLWTGYRPGRPALILLIGILFGGGIEVLQEIMALGRSFEWWDLAADVAGVITGFLLRSRTLPALWPEIKNQ